jgi:glycosyltransferase involved in cell wall biosynthesis
MKIWIVLDYCLPNDGVNTLQVVKTAEALYRLNKDTTLIVPTDNNITTSKENICDYYNVKSPFPIEQIPSRTGKVGLLRKEKLLHPAHVFKLMSDKPDLVLTRHWPSAYFAMAYGIPTFYETYKVFRGKLKIFLPLVRGMLKKPRLKAIIAHSELSEEVMKTGSRLDEKIVTIHNGCDEDLMLAQMDQVEARKRLGIKNKKTVVYTGHLGVDKGVQCLLEIARQTPEVQYLLVGFQNKKEQQRLEVLEDKQGIGNVSIYPWVSPKELGTFLYAADLTIIPPVAKPFLIGRTGLPLKVFDYLASGRPIIAPDVEYLKPILSHGHNAWLVPSDDPHGAAESIRQLYLMENKRKEISKNGKNTALRFTWNKRAERLLELFSENLSQ